MAIRHIRTSPWLGAALGTAVLIGGIAAALSAPTAHGPAATAGKTDDSVTFAKDIAPIVYQNCASCHRPGEVAPFPLLTYQDVQKRAKLISVVTESRYMPPWKADSHGEFFDERRLSTAQIALLKRWADVGAPEGDPADLPPAPRFPPDGWTLGPPDAVVEPSKEYHLAADGNDVYRNFVLPAQATEDRYISAMEVRPGNSKVVHHVIAYLDTSGMARKMDGKDGQPGYNSAGGGIGVVPAGALGGWAPGNLPRRLPDGVGILLPKGADIVLQVHYHKSGKPETDLTRIGLYYCKTPVDKRLRIAPLIYPALHIPPGDAHYTVQASLPVPFNATVLEVMPHMHLLGRSMAVTATLPDGGTKSLVDVPDWDFNWQTTYTFKQPVELPKGSKVSLVARYDNSAGNPRNPSSPPKVVTWGEQTTDEMCIAFVFYTVDAEHLTKGIRVDGLPEFGKNMTRRQIERLLLLAFDKNRDGKLDAGERAAMLQFFLDLKARQAKTP